MTSPSVSGKSAKTVVSLNIAYACLFDSISTNKGIVENDLSSPLAITK